MAKNELKIFAENIKRYRKAAGFQSAEVFAEKLKIPYPTYRDIEAGVSEGRLELRSAIAETFNCTIADFYKDQKNPRGYDFSVAGDFLSTFSDLSPDYQKIVLALVYMKPHLARDVPAKTAKDFLKSLL